MAPVIYATNGWGVHDDRWVAALTSLNFTPIVISLGNDVADGIQLRERVQQIIHENPGCRILAGPLDSVTAHLRGLPYLVGLSWGFDLQEPASEILNLITSLDGLLVDTKMNQDLATNQGLDPSQVTYLPWGVDLELFTSQGESTQGDVFDLDTRAPIVLSLRAHEPRYRVGDIIEAFAITAMSDPMPALVIGNTGSRTSKLKKRVAQLEIRDRVRFIGSVNESDLPKLLRSASAYVSASEIDGTSVTMLQAMACGVPCVVSDLPQNRAWIANGVSGFTFSTGDVADLGKALHSALTGERVAIGQAAIQQISRNADWHANLPRLAQALMNA